MVNGSGKTVVDFYFQAYAFCVHYRKNQSMHQVKGEQKPDASSLFCFCFRYDAVVEAITPLGYLVVFEGWGNKEEVR